MIVATREKGEEYIKKLNIENPRTIENSFGSLTIFGDNMNVFLYYYPQSAHKRTWKIRINDFSQGNI